MRSWPHTFQTIVVALRRWRCFARVEVGAKIVAGYAGGFLHFQDVFGGERLFIFKPSEDNRLPLIKQATEGRLGTCRSNSSAQR